MSIVYYSLPRCHPIPPSTFFSGDCPRSPTDKRTLFVNASNPPMRIAFDIKGKIFRAWKLKLVMSKHSMRGKSRKRKNVTLSSFNAFSVQLSRINTSKSFVISHNFSDTFPRMFLMLFFTYEKRRVVKNGTHFTLDVATLGAQRRQSIIHWYERGIFDARETICL